jgi:TonB family protein
MGNRSGQHERRAQGEEIGSQHSVRTINTKIHSSRCSERVEEVFMRIRPFCIGLILILLSSPLALCQSELGKWWKNSEIVKKLQITEAQVEQIERIFLNHQPKLAEANAKLIQRDDQLKALMQNDRIDDARTTAQADLVAAARAELEKINASLMISIRKTLSKEQWNRLTEIRTAETNSSSQTVPAPKVSAVPGIKAVTAPLPPGVFTVGGPVKAPQIINMTKPSYTQEAKAAKIEGIIILEAVVQKDGSVGQIDVKRGLGYGLDESAIHAIKNEWKFNPGTMNGKPVNVRVFLEVSFRLY